MASLIHIKYFKGVSPHTASWLKIIFLIPPPLKFNILSTLLFIYIYLHAEVYVIDFYDIYWNEIDVWGIRKRISVYITNEIYFDRGYL